MEEPSQQEQAKEEVLQKLESLKSKVEDFEKFYDGLNRKQRRAFQAQNRKLFRKKLKERK